MLLQARTDADLPCDVHAQPCGKHVADDDLIDEGCINSRERCLARSDRQVHRSTFGERPHEPADGRAFGCNDVDALRHGVFLCLLETSDLCD
jgi:hypothetical protein